MASRGIDEARLESLASSFEGELLRGTDGGYDDARRIFNGMIDLRPALIARCRGTGDVVRALAFARESGLEISVRGGGHGVAGRALTDDGLMIDLSTMKEIDVDPEARTVRAQGGVTWGELNDATATHGLATACIGGGQGIAMIIKREG